MSAVEAAREWEVAFALERTEVSNAKEAYTWLAERFSALPYGQPSACFYINADSGQLIFASSWPRDIFEANCEDETAFAMFIEMAAWSGDA
jgi:hypothetical protein